MRSVELSVVVPAYNEAESLGPLVERLTKVLTPIVSSFEIIIVDDGSRDRSEAVMDELSKAYETVVPIVLSRNFGKESAISAGLTVATGDGVVVMDADMQHPPETVPELVRSWREGFDIVNAVKVQRDSESILYRCLAGLFNRWMSAVIGADMSGASDFKLLDRSVVDVLVSLPERNRFFRGLVAWVGFRVTEVGFSVEARKYGTSKWSLGSLIRYSISNITSFSSFPLKLIAYLGFSTAATGTLLLVQTLYNFFSGTAALGFTTVIALQIMIGGVILLAIGVMSTYMGRIYEEQKSRPMFVLKNKSLVHRAARESGVEGNNAPQ